jgi:hypothetical protein
MIIARQPEDAKLLRTEHRGAKEDLDSTAHRSTSEHFELFWF